MPVIETYPEVRPSGYRIITAPDWHRIDVDPDYRDKGIALLLDRQFAGIDNLPQVRRALADDLRSQAEQAWENGGVEIYLSMLQAGPFPVSASLVVGYSPPVGRELDDVDALAELLVELNPGDERVETSNVPLVAGPSVRRVARRQQTVLDQPNRRLIEVQYLVPIPHGEGAMLMLTFSSPLVELADALITLFDATADTLRWTVQESDLPREVQL